MTTSYQILKQTNSYSRELIEAFCDDQGNLTKTTTDRQEALQAFSMMDHDKGFFLLVASDKSMYKIIDTAQYQEYGLPL